MKKTRFLMLAIAVCLLLVFTLLPTHNARAMPCAPTGLQAACTACNQISLSWNPSSDTDLYYIFRCNCYLGSYTLVSSVTSPAYTDTKLCPTNPAYYYKVIAVSSNCMSPCSAAVSALTNHN